MYIERSGDRSEREEPKITSAVPHRSPAPRDPSSLQFSLGASVGPEALAAGSEPGRWPGDHAPEKGHAPFSLAQQIVAHRRCTKEPMTASLCQEVGGMAGAWERAWSAAGDSSGIAPRLVPRERCGSRKVLKGRGRRLGQRKMVCARTARQRSERPKERDTPPQASGPASVYPLDSLSATWDPRPVTFAPQHLPWENLWCS